MKKIIVLLTTLMVCQMTYAQTQDALVFFADKEDVQASIDNPISILTQDAIDRKALHGVAIDERDVPVNEAYISQVKDATGITVLAKSKWLNCVYVQGSQSNIEGLMGLSFVTSIEWANKDMNFPTPSSTRISDKFDIENSLNRVVYDYGAAANQIELISGDFLHEEDFTGEGMVIAVLDAGFPNVNTIPAFSDILDDNRLLGTFDFVNRTTDVTGTGSHGTRTFSDIGGFLENQFVGTAPGASFYLFRTEYAPDENPREEAWWVAALERSDSLGVDVVNTSLGYQDYDNSSYDHSYEDLDGVSTIAARGANIAFEKGMLLVTSGGNDGNGFGTVATPADALGVLAIGAVDAGGNYVSFSSRGPTVDGRIKPDVMSQGQDSAVITEDGNVSTSNGTSFSSPILAGAVACLWQSRPETNNATVMQLVRESAHLYDNPTDEMGYGIPNFEDAYNALQLLSIQDQFLVENFAVYPNPTKDIVFVSMPANLDGAEVMLYNVLGSLIMKKTIRASANSLDISELSSGMYIATIKGKRVSNTFKIIKR